jgi:hypothetical protein
MTGFWLLLLGSGSPPFRTPSLTFPPTECRLFVEPVHSRHSSNGALERELTVSILLTQRHASARSAVDIRETSVCALVSSQDDRDIVIVFISMLELIISPVTIAVNGRC